MKEYGSQKQATTTFLPNPYLHPKHDNLRTSFYDTDTQLVK
jgi:hypothetical protein